MSRKEENNHVGGVYIFVKHQEKGASMENKLNSCGNLTYRNQPTSIPVLKGGSVNNVYLLTKPIIAKRIHFVNIRKMHFLLTVI